MKNLANAASAALGMPVKAFGDRLYLLTDKNIALGSVLVQRRLTTMYPYIELYKLIDFEGCSALPTIKKILEQTAKETPVT